MKVSRIRVQAQKKSKIGLKKSFAREKEKSGQWFNCCWISLMPSHGGLLHIRTHYNKKNLYAGPMYFNVIETRTN